MDYFRIIAIEAKHQRLYRPTCYIFRWVGLAHGHSPIKHFAVSVLMGLSLAIVFLLLQEVMDLPVLPDPIRLSLQDYLQGQSDLQADAQAQHGPKIRLIDLKTMDAPDQGVIARSDFAKIVPVLDAAGAAVILLDGDFSAARPADHDLALALGRLKHSKVVLPLRASDRSSGRCRGRTDYGQDPGRGLGQIFWPNGELARPRALVWYGGVETEEDSDSASRSFCTFTTAFGAAPGDRTDVGLIIPSVAVVAAALFQEGREVTSYPRRWQDTVTGQGDGPRPGLALMKKNDLTADDFEPARYRFLTLESGNFTQPPAPGKVAAGIMRYPADLLIDPEADLSDLKDAILVVGTEDRESGDWHNVAGHRRVSGLVTAAMTISATLRMDFLHRPENKVEEFLIEIAVIIVGCIWFSLLIDGVPAFARLSLRWLGFVRNPLGGQTPITIGFRFFGKTIGFIAASIIVTASLVLLQYFLAMREITHHVEINFAASILSILVERLIHVGVTVDKIYNIAVDYIYSKCSGPKNPGPPPPQTVVPQHNP